MAPDASLTNFNDSNFALRQTGFVLRFREIIVTPVSKDPGKVLLTWELHKSNADLSDYEFYIDRGEAEDQVPSFQHVTIDGRPWKSEWPSATTDSTNLYQVAGPISALDFYEWVDYTPQMRNLHKHYFYRVRIRRLSTQEEIGSTSITWHGDLDLEGLYVVDEHNYLLEDTTGMPSLALKKRRSGVTCTSCFDPIQKKRTQSFCQRCYGTNWEGGFHKPIDLFADFTPSVDATIVREWGETQPSESDVLVTNYPRLSTGDMLIELKEGRRWRVTQVRRTEKRLAPMLQFVRVIEINPGDVEYTFPLDQEFVREKVRQFEEYKKRREF